MNAPGVKPGPGPANAATARPASIRSMTGYAQARTVEHGRSLRISVRSVNHRFLDLHLHVPEGFEPVEPRMRQLVREHLRRGHVDVTLHYELEGAAAVGVNRDIAAAYLQAANSLRAEFDIQAEPDVTTLLRLPGVIGLPSTSLEGEMQRIEAAVAACLTEALEKLNHMRHEEAKALGAEMSSRLRTIANLSSQVAVLAERARPAFARRLEARLKDLLGEAQLDPTRLAQEAAFAAERSDVSEEITRLGSHVQQFESLLAGAADTGKKMDFLLQEMQRETNTLLSKTPGNDGEGLEITRLALEIKSEIEKLREQVQNIE
jgi:uncharacterized protein (TIGR00255 family)